MTIGSRKLVIVVVVLGAVVLTGCPGSLVFFQDKALESAIRANIGKPFGLLTQDDLLSVVSLDARGLNIKNLTGLEYCTNLTRLDLDTNSVEDLAPLAQLGRPDDPFNSPLTYLNLDGNDITDITPLAGLLNLHGLSLFNNQIADITPLVTNALNGGLGSGDYVILDAATLNDTAVNVDVPQLESLGVNVTLVGAAGTTTTTGTTTTGTRTGK